MRYFLPFLVLLVVSGYSYAQTSRGLGISHGAKNGAATAESIKNVALVIGTSDYKSWKHLPNPVFDAETIKEELERDYGYEVTLLKNPTKNQVLEKLYTLNERFASGAYGENANFFIFIAGHGGYDRFMNGYIVPSDAQDQVADRFHSTCIPYDNLRSIVDNINAKHTLVVLDACFGGTFDQLISNSGHRGEESYNLIDYNELLQRKMQYHSRKYITSGGKEYVPDGRPGFHSPFAYQLIKTLRESYDRKEVLTFSRLCDNLSRVRDNEPRAGDFGINDPGSDYILLPTSLSTGTAANAQAPKVDRNIGLSSSNSMEQMPSTLPAAEPPKPTSSEPDNKPLSIVEKMPEPSFNISQFLSANIQYPKDAIENNITGRVVVKFVVNEDGSISDVAIARSVGGGLDEEALRVVRLMPRWRPGYQNGKPVKVFFNLPIAFKLEDPTPVQNSNNGK